MTNGAKAAIGGTLVLVLAVGLRFWFIYKERNEPAALQPVVAQEKITDDQLVYLKKKHQDSMKEVRDLVGSTLWVSAGGQMDYYPVAGRRVEYGKSAGTLLGADKLLVKDMVEQVAPKAATFRIPGGDRQVSMVFTKPGDEKEYAVPIGYREGGQYTFFVDEVFFYEDPHELYKHWGPEVWKAVDEHKVIVGMSELEVELALGQVSKSTSNDYGNRMVVFANLGHPIAVTFVKNKVTAFREDQGY